MKAEELAQYFDATNLKLDASHDDIRKLCADAAEVAAYSVMVYPSSVRLCKSLLKGTKVQVGTVIGFPSGRYSTRGKETEIVQAIDAGGDEMDVVMNYAELKAGNRSYVVDELSKLTEICHDVDVLIKVIVETCYLTDDEILDSLKICEEAKADFIKTSTGFGSAGAQVKDIETWRDNRTSDIKIKAAGGIRTLADAMKFINAGAERLGLSAAIGIIDELNGAAASESVSSY